MMPMIRAAGSGAALLMQGADGAAQPGGSLVGMLVPMALIFVIFYFLLIRPANKKQKALQAMLEGLKNGDKVITTGGILGVVVGITDDVIHLKVSQLTKESVKIEISRNAVAALQKDQGEKE